MNAILSSKEILMIRIQRVRVNGTKADWLNVNHGVPPRTILGPFLFLLYVKDMTNYCNLNTEIFQYAVDRLIFTGDKNHSNAKEATETQIERLYSFLQKNELQLNALKTKFLKFSKDGNPGNLKMSIKVGEDTIQAGTSMKYMGIGLDCDLSFQSQIKTTISNMAPSFRTLHQIKKCLPSTTLILLFKTLVLGQMEYLIL